MRSVHTSVVALFAILVLFLASCSGGGHNQVDPIAPGLQVSQKTFENNRVLWGVWQISVDPETLEPTVVPWRQVEGHLNVREWLENPPCSNCLKVLSIEDGIGGTKLIEVELTHPYSNPNLTGFDVRGIPMFDYGVEFGLGWNIPTRESGRGELANADGHTYLYNYHTAGQGPDGLQGYSKGNYSSDTIPPDALINGYLRHISDDPANTRCAFYAGDSVARTYEIVMPDTFVFGYAVDASWVPATNKPVDDPMEDFPPEANCYEPWKIFVNEFPIGNGLDSAGGWTRLVIDVYDHQGPSTHAAPVITCPDITQKVTAELKEAYSDHATYEAIIHNSEGAPAGTYRCLISVLDDEWESAPSWILLEAFKVIKLIVDPYEEDSGWAKTWGAVSDDAAYGVECDQYGNVFVTGGFQGKVDFNPGFYHDDHTSNGSYDAFLTKYNELGAYQWTVTFGGSGIDQGSSVAVGFDDGVYVAGKFQGVVDFDPDSGTEEECSHGGYDGFLAKYDWIDGHFIWVRIWGGAQDDVADAVATDTFHTTDVIAAGSFRGTVKFWPTAGDSVSHGETDAYIIKFQPDGGFNGRLTWGGENLDEANCVATGEDGAFAVTGYFMNNDDASGVDFNPGAGTDTHVSWGSSDVFLSMFDEGNGFLWSKHWGGPDMDSGNGVMMSPAADYGLIYVTGYYQGTIDFDPGPDTYFEGSQGLGDVYLVRYGLDGEFIWGRSWGGTGMDIGFDVDSHDYPAPIVTGYFSGSCDFDPGAPNVVGTSHGGTDVFFSSFSENAEFSFARTWGGPGDDIGYAVGAPYWQRYYVAGVFSGTDIEFDPCVTVDLHSDLGGTDAFVSKFMWDGCW